MGEHNRIQLAAYALGALVLVVVGARVLGPEAAVPEPPRVAVDGAAASDAGRRPGPEEADRRRGVYVHVAGAVRRQGIYRLPADARVSAALKRARGPTPRADMTAVNLAAPVRDGQQVVVPVRGAAPAGGTGGASASTAPGSPGAPGAAGARVSLSQATPEQLDQLDGIGPALAARIVEYRTAHGGFRSVDELQQVDGIGPKRFEALRGSVDP